MNAALQILLHYRNFLKSIIHFKNPFIKNITNLFIEIRVVLLNNDNIEKKENFIINSFTQNYFYKEFIKKHPIFIEEQRDSI